MSSGCASLAEKQICLLDPGQEAVPFPQCLLGPPLCSSCRGPGFSWKVHHILGWEKFLEHLEYKSPKTMQLFYLEKTSLISSFTDLVLQR